ncbi:hypothetical protein KBB96_14515 [Luteolibacter ambystomatis]|uniref:Uncharacterized protein n=1 Tax=Luteolibacter ambystomatis TaxID=2824561 RepID=A0A975G7A1_9BACT|nr:hypothetical protein [Luteolibacter ambystomatis]QUE50076.1 hypothetical protein KBB96_14515 [Luteolibacter ambystomatis]
MKRRNGFLKTVALPLLVAALAYEGTRLIVRWTSPTPAETGSPDLPRSTRPPDAGEILRTAKNDLHGLARRRAMVELASTPSLGALERLRSSGRANWQLPDPVVQACAARDPEATWRFLIGGGDAAITSHAQIVLTEWLKKDPEAFTGILRVTSGFSDRRSIAEAAMRFLEGTDDTLAAAAMKHFEILVSIDPDLANSLTSTGPERDRFLSRLLALKPSNARDRIWAGIADRWLAKDWLAATTWAESLPAESRRQIEARFTETAFASKNPDDGPLVMWAVKWLSRKASSGDVSRLGPLYVKALAQTQPDEALEWAGSHLSGYPLAQAMGSIAATRFATDPDGAREMVANLAAGGTQQTATAAIAMAWARTDPVGAVSWWLEFPHDSNGPTEFTRLRSQLTKAQLEEFSAYALEPETPALPSILASLAVNYENPVSTVDQVEPATGANRERILTSAVSYWATQDPAAAAARLTESPDLLNTTRAKRITDQWYQSDRAATVAWAAGLPDEEIRGSLEASLREKISQDPVLNPKQKRALIDKLQ